MPAEKDYVVVAAEWEARRVYNFIRGVASRSQTVTLVTGHESLQVTEVISYSHNPVDHHKDEGIIRVKCMDGWVLLPELQ
jgi:methionyl-tRNA formyltransferase